MVTAQSTPPRRTLRAFLRFRPRVLTLAVLAVVTATLVLANLSSEPSRELGPVRYGWPLIWHWHDVVWGVTVSGGELAILSWEYNARRLAANAGLWFLMATIPSSACEYLLRRFTFKWRWCLRTMLAGVAVLAAMCAWFAAARHRANNQDQLIVSINGPVWLARSGPRWLDLLGLDRYRRQIVGANLRTKVRANGDREVEDLLHRLSGFPTMDPTNDSIVVPSASELRQIAALQALRKARPGILIDNAGYYWDEYDLFPPEYEDANSVTRVWLPAAGLPWISPAQGPR